VNAFVTLVPTLRKGVADLVTTASFDAHLMGTNPPSREG
jgi:hypothetical protein